MAHFTQLVSYSSYRGGVDSEHSDGYELDNFEIYTDSEKNITVNLPAEVPFKDNPGIQLDGNPVTLHDDFQTYLRFRPDEGSDNIYVTLGLVTWSCDGTSVLQSNGISYTNTTTSAMPIPVPDDTVSTPPRWTKTALNAH